MYPPRGLQTHKPQAQPPQNRKTRTQVGCVYEKGGQNFQEFGPVILASGRDLKKTGGCFEKAKLKMKKTLVV